MDKKNFNIFIYFGKMLLCAVLWTIIVCIMLTILYGIPEKIITVTLPPNDKLTLNINYIVGILIAVFSHYFLVFETKTYYYSFQTKCKNPLFMLITNIIFGAFVCNITLHFFDLNSDTVSKITTAFLAISAINYFFFYSHHGNELRETSFVDEWTKDVH